METETEIKSESKISSKMETKTKLKCESEISSDEQIENKAKGDIKTDSMKEKVKKKSESASKAEIDIEKEMENLMPFQTKFPRELLQLHRSPYIYVKKNVVVSLKMFRMKPDNEDQTLRIYDYQKKINYEKMQAKLRYINDDTFSHDPFRSTTTYSCIYTAPGPKPQSGNKEQEKILKGKE